MDYFYRITSFAALFYCLCALMACSDSPAPTQAAKSVTVIEVQPKDTPVSFEFVGRTASSQQVQVRSRVEGFLDDRLYTEGSIVTKGDVMFKVDPKPFETQLAAAKAALAEQKAKLEISVIPPFTHLLPVHQVMRVFKMAHLLIP